MDNRDFRDHAYRLVGQDVEVITVDGTFTGTLLSVGRNFITIRTRIRGRLVRLLIRLALIVAIFRLRGVTGGSSYVFRPSNNMQDENDALSNFSILDDDPPDDPRDDRRSGRRTNRRSERRSNRRSFW